MAMITSRPFSSCPFSVKLVPQKARCVLRFSNVLRGYSHRHPCRQCNFDLPASAPDSFATHLTVEEPLSLVRPWNLRPSCGGKGRTQTTAGTAQTFAPSCMNWRVFVGDRETECGTRSTTDKQTKQRQQQAKAGQR